MNALIELWNSILISTKKELNVTSNVAIKQNLYLLLKYFSIICISSDTLICVKAHAFSSINSITRNLLETLVDFTILLKEPTYSSFLDYFDELNWLKILLEFKTNPSNQYLERFSELDIDDEIKKKKEALKALEEKGCTKLKIEEKFKRADGIDAYKSIYNLLCKETHGDINTLKGRFLSFREGRLVFNLEPNILLSEYSHIIKTNLKVIADCTLKINEIYSILSEGLIQKCKKIMAEIE